MNDERAVEVMAESLNKSGAPLEALWENSRRALLEDAEQVLAALRAEGFDLYRPDDCETVVEPVSFLPGQDRWEVKAEFIYPRDIGRRFRLVPVGGEG